MLFVGCIHFGEERCNFGVHFDHGGVDFILKRLHLIGQIGICVKYGFSICHEFLTFFRSKAAHVSAGPRTTIGGVRRFIS